MKTIIRNFISVLRRFKLATILNVLGLSVAFVAFMVIMMQWNYDRTFDSSDPNADCIFRLEPGSGEEHQAILCRPLADAFAQSSPHIKALALFSPWGNDVFFQVGEGSERKSFREKMGRATPSIVDVFHFDMLEGDAKALADPEKLLLPESLARKMFGDVPVVGEMLTSGESGKSYTVGGVYRDFPDNSSLNNLLLYTLGDENLHEWGNWNYVCYVRVDDPSHAEGLFENFKKSFDVSTLKDQGFSWDSRLAFRLTPIRELHFISNVTYDFTPKSSHQTLMVLFTIALIIVLIAGINFTNFSTALTPMRIKSINTQKVLGGEESVIRSALMLEALAVSLFSFLLAILILAFLPHTSLASMVDADLSLLAHPGLIGITALLAMLTGFLAGLYPAYYMTSFPPALVLKGSFGLSPKGRHLRNVLISVQFIASFALIIGSLFMYLQNYYMQHTPLGYNKDAVIVSDLNKKVIGNQDAFANQLKSYAGITGVTFAQPLLSSSDQYMGWGRGYKDGSINFQCLPVDYSFLQVMGVQLKEGRDFREEDMNNRHGVYIFNEKAKEVYKMEVGDLVDSAQVVGFIPDVKFASFRTAVSPMAFYIYGTMYNWRQPNYVYIKVSGDANLRGAMEHVQATLKSFDSEFPFNVRFFDEVLNNLYEKELNLTSLITLFSLIAVFISIVGVFGLVVFDSEYRKKEIGVRKVLGSTTGQIIIMFNKTYIRVLVICFVLAAPMAWYAVNKWLENFAYKTPMYLWVYVVAFLVVAVITVFTVTFQNWRAANENPVHSIKSE